MECGDRKRSRGGGLEPDVLKQRLQQTQRLPAVVTLDRLPERCSKACYIVCPRSSSFIRTDRGILRTCACVVGRFLGFESFCPHDLTQADA